MARKPIREQLIGDISTGNQTQRKTVCGYDRMRGLAYAPALAIAIKRMQAEVTEGTINNTVFQLHKALFQASPRARSLSHLDRANLCRMAVLERAHPRCTVCKGRAEVFVRGQPVIQCEPCGGSGVRRYSDADRRDTFGRVLEPQHLSALEEAMTLYSHHDSLGEIITADRLYGDDE